MDSRLKYYAQFQKLSAIPEYNRIRAEIRFLLVIQFKYFFAKKRAEAQKSGHSFNRKATLAEFCEINGLSVPTFYRWLQRYKKSGIVGLAPDYGPNRSQMLSAEVAYAEERMQDYDIGESIIMIAVSHKTPLSCLSQIIEFINKNRHIHAKTKRKTLPVLKYALTFENRGNKLSLNRPLTMKEIEILKKYQADNHKNQAAKATALLMANKGKTLFEVCKASNRAVPTIYRWLRHFQLSGLSFIETKLHFPGREELHKEQLTRIMDILHSPPSAYGINRTSWTYDAIWQAYKSAYEQELSRETIKGLVKKTGHSWKHSVKAFTSHDPLYREKVEQVLAVLRGVGSDEAFFFVDESGPWQVKKYGGKMLSPPGQRMVLPEVQYSKGRVNFIVALEAITNQLTWKFIRRKDASTVIDLIGELKREFASKSRIFLTWDSMSSHRSKVVGAWIAEANKSSGPMIEVVPLPSNAQFLNVVEAVIGGMKRAVVDNSDYGSVAEMEAAIGRHFAERNVFFQKNPKRAGDKIWDEQAFDIDHIRGGLFKKW